MVLICLTLSAQNPYSQYTDNVPFTMPEVKAPVFPKRTINLRDYGAKGDGSSLCTDAFAKAINELSAKGGGKLIVPQGVWFTGPIELKSNVNLHLEKGAVVLFPETRTSTPSSRPLLKVLRPGAANLRCPPMEPPTSR